MDWFLLCVVLLFGLALLDLSVGVSNDAVNFLNSAIGSRVATRQTILLVASVGIICGALVSSGMMEVARKGIFNPELFSFAQVMVLFLAVMFADVLLLDLFNTFALPTSTTVSIVFELLGAAVALALISVALDGGGPGVAAHINMTQAGAIIAGIFLSVGVAFAIGALVQFVSRALFTFRIRGEAWVIQVWAALAMTALAWFLLVKGLKGATFVPPVVYQWVSQAPVVACAALVTGFLLLGHLLTRLKFSLLKLVVLFGTFALAMAFASNDLVNFVGVPLAGLAAWRIWDDSSSPAETLTMEQLAVPVSGDTLWLLAAGGVMVLTLWTSAKARSVTETEVNLGRQDSGAERFGPGPLSRSLVRGWLRVAGWMSQVTPQPVQHKLAQRFRAAEPRAVDGPAFDLIRASVNLVTASVLIAIATSLKLPLSTTYVSFMVAMGTSLADRAWGRDSAVYRVAGVLSVIGGWLLTAAMAFTTAAVFAVVLYYFQTAGVAALVLLVAAALFRTHRIHRARQSKPDQTSAPSQDSLLGVTEERLIVQLQLALRTLERVLQALICDDRRALQRAEESMAALEAEGRGSAHLLAAAVPQEKAVNLRTPAAVLAAEQVMTASLADVMTHIRHFVLNLHRPPGSALRVEFAKLQRSARDAARALEGESELLASDRWLGDLALSAAPDTPLKILFRGAPEPADRSVHNATLLLNVVFGLERFQKGLLRLDGLLRARSPAAPE